MVGLLNNRESGSGKAGPGTRIRRGVAQCPRRPAPMVPKSVRAATQRRGSVGRVRAVSQRHRGGLSGGRSTGCRSGSRTSDKHPVRARGPATARSTHRLLGSQPRAPLVVAKPLRSTGAASTPTGGRPWHALSAQPDCEHACSSPQRRRHLAVGADRRSVNDGSRLRARPGSQRTHGALDTICCTPQIADTRCYTFALPVRGGAERSCRADAEK